MTQEVSIASLFFIIEHLRSLRQIKWGQWLTMTGASLAAAGGQAMVTPGNFKAIVAAGAILFVAQLYRLLQDSPRQKAAASRADAVDGQL